VVSAYEEDPGFYPQHCKKEKKKKKERKTAIEGKDIVVFSKGFAFIILKKLVDVKMNMRRTQKKMY
jgi:hypothetical protein